MNELWIILTGMLVASSCALLGCFLILRKMAMVGDAISHAVLPGIVVAFLVTGDRHSLPMLLGAAAFGLVTTLLIESLRKSGVQADAAISVTFTSLFSVGIILVSLFARQVDLDLDCVLYGEIIYVPWDTIIWNGLDWGPKAVWIVGTTLVLNALAILLFYKQLKLSAFDPAMAAALGIPVAFFHYLLMGLVSVTTVASFESVGAILVVAMLIVPAATAYLLTDRLSRMLLYSVLAGCLSAVTGYFLAGALDASVAGAMTVMAGVFFILALILSPRHGLVTRWWQRKRLRRDLASHGE
ncbi:metal ABC transporter permease [Laceyella sacchari]|jgi:manganese/zinc/iron transport system permease protein|uniref:Metal ABC transporter permease n=1 Tax=Laceyella sacchari TaxID=37482 RepID=A0ABY5U9F0_LACSH|nr:metal ABC transporter permease [Laceyella sacchari]TCW41108.1 manganese/zinc/iron transport system permease protein [Laceyella sacchari]UWE04698.1 metal ABC transporter permease [Laceyella sacchari]